MSRYEVNPELVPALEEGGLRFVGKDETGQRMEIVELAPDAVSYTHLTLPTKA